MKWKKYTRTIDIEHIHQQNIFGKHGIKLLLPTIIYQLQTDQLWKSLQ